MSNRALGNTFEQELCEKLYEQGFWVKNLKQDSAGQPADVIAVRNRVAYLIDAKVCTHDNFSLKRVESNQETAMELWTSCGNGQGWFAFKTSNGTFMMPHSVVKSYQFNGSAMKLTDIETLGKQLETWVRRCK